MYILYIYEYNCIIIVAVCNINKHKILVNEDYKLHFITALTRYVKVVHTEDNEKTIYTYTSF